MINSNITRTRKLNLCVSCEICAATCPKDAITMEYKFGQFLPSVDDNKCKHCGLCLEVCPGIDVDPIGLRYKDITSDDLFNGPVLESYTAYSNNAKIRDISASGGLITSLVIELIRKKEFDAAFVLDFDKFDGKPARLKGTNKINEIVNAAKSKYIPASVHNVIKTLEHVDNRRYIVVGTPCQIYGIKKFIKKFSKSEENLLFLGLFCERTLNFNLIQYFEDIYGKSNEKLIKFYFRTKEKYGWPGNSKIYFDSGREVIIDRKIRMKLKQFFQLNRCLFCCDKLNRLADISFGDCYIRGKEDYSGKSSVITRTKKGKNILDNYSYLFTLEKENIGEIRSSQGLINKKDNLEYAKIIISENNIYSETALSYRIGSKVFSILHRLQKYTKWGRKYDIYKIKLFLFLQETLNQTKNKTMMIKKAVAIGIAIIKDTLAYATHRKRVNYGRGRKGGNIIIVGGNFYNKGAQAMTFTVVDQIKRRFPDSNIYLFSSRDFEINNMEKYTYNFNILPWDARIKMSLLSSWKKLDDEKTNYSYLKGKIENIVRNAAFFVDISGYALSSQWGFRVSIGYLLNIILAKKYSVPFYILPQSIGPFDYPLKQKILLYPLLAIYLKYPRRIFLREEEGLKYVNIFTKRNTERSYDIILQSEGYDLTNIYKKSVYFKQTKIRSSSIGVVPNVRLLEHGTHQSVNTIYNLLIRKLISNQKTVYILKFSCGDLQMCRQIKNFFPDNKNVKLISEDLNVIELENVLKQFDFVIASRYHSIIHAYKNGIPALVIGWATKYFELLRDFDQLEYFIDCRGNMSITELESKLLEMVKNHKHERDKIRCKLNNLKKKNIFDIFEKYRY